jgi:hypothetical protein
VVARKPAPEESRPHDQHPSRHSSVACHGSLPGADPVRALAYLVVMLRLASQRIAGWNGSQSVSAKVARLSAYPYKAESTFLDTKAHLIELEGQLSGSSAGTSAA